MLTIPNQPDLSQRGPGTEQQNNNILGKAVSPQCVQIKHKWWTVQRSGAGRPLYGQWTRDPGQLISYRIFTVHTVNSEYTQYTQ